MSVEGGLGLGLLEVNHDYFSVNGTLGKPFCSIYQNLLFYVKFLNPFFCFYRATHITLKWSMLLSSSSNKRELSRRMEHWIKDIPKYCSRLASTRQNCKANIANGANKQRILQTVALGTGCWIVFNMDKEYFLNYCQLFSLLRC